MSIFLLHITDNRTALTLDISCKVVLYAVQCKSYLILAIKSVWVFNIRFHKKSFRWNITCHTGTQMLMLVLFKTYVKYLNYIHKPPPMAIKIKATQLPSSVAINSSLWPDVFYPVKKFIYSSPKPSMTSLITPLYVISSLHHYLE